MAGEKDPRRVMIGVPGVVVAEEIDRIVYPNAWRVEAVEVVTIISEQITYQITGGKNSMNIEWTPQLFCDGAHNWNYFNS